MYYQGKLETLRAVFGTDDVQVEPGAVVVDGRRLPVLDDVIVALDAARLPDSVRARLPQATSNTADPRPFAQDIQFSFGDEWTRFREVLPEHQVEFRQYFDLVNLDELADARVCDLGCGSGRWATFVAPHCREMVLVDYSEAIFVARRNMIAHPHAVFVMADVLALPFADDTFDFAYCLGVLHHLPVPALDALRRIVRLAPHLLVYLYYALDNRPWYFRALLRPVTWLRLALARVRGPRSRGLLSWLLAALVYWPVSVAGRVLQPLGSDRWLPLAEAYTGKSLGRLRQDAYDRFFTRIEQRFRRVEIEALAPEIGSVTVSEGQPYWHFVVERH